jgi:hypothetical protein
MAKLPQGDIILPEMLPAANLGSGTSLVNKWNHWSPRPRWVGG